MNSFRDALLKESNHTYTENGADALKSTTDSRLDLFAQIGALRNDPDRLIKLVKGSYSQDPLFTAKILFYARDIREGLGERQSFRTVLTYLADNHPESILPNIPLIGFFGRFDDLYSLIGTRCEDSMWKYMKMQLEEDIDTFNKGGHISLLAKWIKTPDASSEKTRKLGITTALKLGYTVPAFKRVLRKLRKHIDIVEARMSANEWGQIEYESVPGRAAMIYRNAFVRHDKERYNSYIADVNEGKAKINANTLYPYDIVEKILSGEDSPTLEAQWNSLPDYTNGDGSTIVVADVSGSMRGRPMATSIGLALYFAERTEGVFRNMFISFSENPVICTVKGDTLAEKIQNCKDSDWGYNTDMEKVFRLILDLAVENNIPQEEMPANLMIVSDMQFDSATECGNRWSTYYDAMSSMFREQGYTLPNIVFWNVNAKADTFHTDACHKGVQMVSGSSPSVFKSLMQSLGMTPVEYMESVINSERYSAVSLEA